MTAKKSDRLDNFNNTLTSVENELLRRKVDRQDKDIENAVDTMNDLAKDGVIELTGCDGGEPEPCDGDAAK